MGKHKNKSNTVQKKYMQLYVLITVPADAKHLANYDKQGAQHAILKTIILQAQFYRNERNVVFIRNRPYHKSLYKMRKTNLLTGGTLLWLF